MVQLTKAGHTFVKAVDAAGTTMRTFRKTRYIVEMKYAHLSTFLNLESVYTTKNSLAVECQKELKKSVHHEKRMTNFLNGLCLKPFKCNKIVIDPVYSPDLLCNLQQLLPLDLK